MLRIFLEKGFFYMKGKSLLFHVAESMSSRVCLYPNSQISINLMRLAISGNFNPNPGPVSLKASKAHLAELTRKNYVSCLSLSAKSIVNKIVDLRSR